MSGLVDDDALDEMPDAASDAALFEHNRRFQAAVLLAMDKQMAHMEELAATKDRQLQGSEAAREDLAIGFAEMRKELMRINKNYDKTAAELRQSSHSHLTLKNENLHLKSELSLAQKQASALDSELGRLRGDLGSARDELHAGKQLHQVFSSDLAMHRLLKENMQGELRSVQAELKKAQAGAEEMQGRWDKKEAECASLRSALDSQSKQTSLAQAELERVVHELTLLRASREVMTRQWEGALTAMHKRDQTMSTVAAQKTAAQAEALALRNAESSLSQEVTALRSSVADLQSKLSDSTKRYDDLVRGHDDLRRSHADLTKLAEQAAGEKVAQVSASADLARQNALLTTENQRLSLRAHQLRDEAALLQSRLDAAKDLNRNINQSIASVENVAVARTEGENKELQRRLVVLDNERQAEVNKSIELVVQVKEMARANATLNDEHRSMESKYDGAVMDLKQCQIQLDHMTYRANKAESEALALRTVKEEERRSEQQAMQGQLRHLEKELQCKQGEVAKMNAAFVLAEEKVLDAHKMHAEITTKTERLRSELRKAEGVKDRMKHSIETLTGEKHAILAENTDQRLTNRKFQAQIHALATENTALKTKLADAQFLVQQREENHAAMAATQKAEVVRARERKGATMEVLEASEREKGVWERKHEFLAVKFANQSAELEKFQNLFFTLQKQVQSSHKEQSLQEKQYAGWMKNFELMFDKQTRKKAASGGGGGGGGGPGSGPKLTFSASQSMSARQVLENYSHTAAALPANSATFATSPPTGSPSSAGRLARGAGASIMAGGSGGGGGGVSSSGAAPALDSLNDMMALMARSGVAMHSQPGGNGSASARTLSDSDSRSSLLGRDSHGAKSASFLEGLVHELRTALHKASTLAAGRQHELVRLRAEMKALLVDQNAAATREHELLQRAHLLHTQQQSLSTNLLLSQQAYYKAEHMCASLEKQLREAHRLLLASHPHDHEQSEQKDGSSNSSSSSAPQSGAILTIDYQLYSDLDPSPLLRSILNAPLHSSSAALASNSASMQSLSNYSGNSTAALHAPLNDDAKSIQQHGRSARVGLGRPHNRGGGSGGASGGLGLSVTNPDQLLHSSPSGSDNTAGHSAIASTISLVSSKQSMANLSAQRSAASSSATLSHRGAHATSHSFLSSSSSAALDAPNPSAQNSFSNLPIVVTPRGAK